MNKSDQLTDLRDEMLETLADMRSLLQGTEAQTAAESYWIAHVETALTKDHGYLGGSMVDCDDTIATLKRSENASEPKFDVDDEVLVDGEKLVVTDVELAEVSEWESKFMYHTSDKQAYFEDELSAA